MVGRRTQFWIDGYNVILRQGRGDDREMRARRRDLAGKVAASGYSAWIVYDSRMGEGDTIERPIRRITVQYTRDGMSADDLIANRAQRTDDLSRVVVVTDDRELAKRCRFFGARSLGVFEFLRLIEKNPNPSPKMEDRLSKADIDQWKDYFGVEDEEIDRLVDDELRRADDWDFDDWDFDDEDDS